MIKYLNINDVLTFGGLMELLSVSVFGDVHSNLIKRSPYPTIEALVDGTNSDLIFNLGDNSGKAVKLDAPYVSLLGNHDVSELKKEVGESKLSATYYRGKANSKFFTQDLTPFEGILRKWNYGVFADRQTVRFIHELSEFREYYIIVNTYEGDVALMFRHYPFYGNDYGLSQLKGIKKEYDDVKAIYTIGAHLHRDYLSIAVEDIFLYDKMIPVVQIVLPPFTQKKCNVIAGMYNFKILSDGSINISENFVKSGVIKEVSLVGHKSNKSSKLKKNIKKEIAWGELIG